MSRIPSRRRAVIALVFLALAAAFATYSAIHKGDEAIEQSTNNERRIEAAEPAVAVAKARADTAQDKATKADRRIRTLTRIIVEKQIAVQGKDGLRGGPGPVGNVGPRGPAGVVPFTFSSVLANLSPQLVAAIPNFVSVNCGGTCKGADGLDGAHGADGRDASQEQVDEAVSERIAAALAAACGGPCNGTNGVDGAAAAPITQEQVNAGVAVYCDAHNQCASTVPGPAGADGTNGTNGADGVTTTVVVVCTGPGAPNAACP